MFPEVVQLVFMAEGLAVVPEEVQLRQELLLSWVDGVLSEVKLDDSCVCISDCVVILDLQRLEVLHETPLEIATPGCLDSRVDQPFPPSHTMEVELLLSKSS